MACDYDAGRLHADLEQLRMITLHSIDLKYVKDPCFALAPARYGGCKLLTTVDEKCGTYKCPFYKPLGCKDWVRVEDRQGTALVPEEEYYRQRRTK